MSSFYPKIDLAGRIQNSRLDMGIQSMPSARLDELSAPGEIKSFKGVMSGLVENLNQEINAPDQLLKDAMSGNGDVDIHDVMTAMAKAELSVNVATQITTKVIQAYDKIMQIQV
ncbi:MAG TPA: flagellar hook-basal body complex protein FliE [Candidatus Gastranaerophilaceae bacterium]|nr:flagellar hook-basal body complex protein FliE [Candidatus Gastranaerophilaceae bacterium]HPT40905.1 flagellar hook-basal body complex protein FliE [Candidatus Gastranaerophilaceae bacterium]